VPVHRVTLLTRVYCKRVRGVTDTIGKSAMEPSFGPRSYLGTRGGHEETTPTTVQRLIPGKNFETKFILRGGEL